MSKERQISGLTLKIGPLGENDRLLTVLSDQEGVTRLAVPGARRPKSSLAAAIPLTFLQLHIVGRRSMPKVKHIKVIKSFNNIGRQLEILSAAQALTEISLQLVAINDPLAGLLSTMLVHLERLETISKKIPTDKSILTLASTVQAIVHLLALGGYGLPLQTCCRSGLPLHPPIGQWDWRCTLLPEEGFAIGEYPNSTYSLNPSELALLQRLPMPSIPLRKDGTLLGPHEVWMKLLGIVEFWIKTHLRYNVRALNMLKETLSTQT